LEGAGKKIREGNEINETSKRTTRENEERLTKKNREVKTRAENKLE
jgi:hypothetical protein